MQAKYINKATELAKDIIRKCVVKGDIVVDATVGNGNDTIFLCELVGSEGKVYGFDIQSEAIQSTKEKLNKKNMLERTFIFNSGHENMEEYIEGNIAAIMFNLGYLPRFDHEITTKYDTTIKAVKQGIKLLKKNGIITIAVYPGHHEGMEEKIKLIEYLSTIDQKEINVLKMEFVNQINNPPLLLVLEKKI